MIHKFRILVKGDDSAPYDHWQSQARSIVILESLGLDWRSRKWRSGQGNNHTWVVQAPEDFFKDKVTQVKCVLSGVEVLFNETHRDLLHAKEKASAFLKTLED